ncbi:MAG: amidase family protein [Gammaproteobacteria bacterium]|nr:amidase family protein [Gammaproteobacteria bacterium]
MRTPPTIRQLLDAFAAGEARCEAVVAEALAAAERSDGVFIRIDFDALDQAARIDRARAAGEALPALAGVPVTLKDLFNVQGQQTLAGSKALKEEAPVEPADAVVVGHLRGAGALFIGRANMSEFAFSGMGLNPHYGNPKCIWDRATGRLPGGSSSGGAVSVAEGIVPATIGSDTAGSCRVPAAFNGIVGVKPTYGRLSLRGAYPLSKTSDAPGPLAHDVDGCFILDHVMRGALKHGEALPKLAPRAPSKLRLTLPAESAVMEALDAEVAAAFERALGWLEDAGVCIDRAPLPALDGCVDMFKHRAVAVFEAWQDHAERIRRCGDEYDPFVRQRMSNGRSVSAEQRRRRYQEKAELAASCAQQMRDARAEVLVYPTTPCIPPPIAEVENSARMPEINLRILRNASTVNYFDGCAVSLPCHTPGQAPVGLMLAAGHGDDEALYEIAGAVEDALERGRMG